MYNNTLNQPLDPELRRKAAYLTLSEVMSEEQLMHALWMLEKRDQSADKLSYIGFVGVTAELMGINSSVVSSLYPKLNNNLSLPAEELPADPMPQMLTFKGIEDKQAGHSSQPPSTQQPTQKSGSNKNKRKGSVEMIVFVALICRLTSELSYPNNKTYLFFKEALTEQLHQSDVDDNNRIQLIAWSNTLNIKSFKNNFNHNELSKMFHCVYIAICEAEGPVVADKALNSAINFASTLKAAKDFSPRNLL